MANDMLDPIAAAREAETITLVELDRQLGELVRRIEGNRDALRDSEPRDAGADARYLSELRLLRTRLSDVSQLVTEYIGDHIVVTSLEGYDAQRASRMIDELEGRELPDPDAPMAEQEERRRREEAREARNDWGGPLPPDDPRRSIGRCAVFYVTDGDARRQLCELPAGHIGWHGKPGGPADPRLDPKRQEHVRRVTATRKRG